MRSFAYWYTKTPMRRGREYDTERLSISISYTFSSTMTSSCRNLLFLINIPAPRFVQYFTSRCLSRVVTVFPDPEFPKNFIVSAIIARSGSASPARRASDTESPNARKQAFGSYCITRYTRVTTRPLSKYYLRRGVASRILSPR